ncbi:unnamed protein product [Musa acuminata subsp. burmannicoides]
MTCLLRYPKTCRDQPNRTESFHFCVLAAFRLKQGKCKGSQEAPVLVCWMNIWRESPRQHLAHVSTMPRTPTRSPMSWTCHPSFCNLLHCCVETSCASGLFLPPH